MTAITHDELRRIRDLSDRIRSVADPKAELTAVCMRTVSTLRRLLRSGHVCREQVAGELTEGDAFALALLAYTSLMAAKFVKTTDDDASIKRCVDPWLAYTPNELDSLVARVKSRGVPTHESPLEKHARTHAEHAS